MAQTVPVPVFVQQMASKARTTLIRKTTTKTSMLNGRNHLVFIVCNIKTLIIL